MGDLDKIIDAIQKATNICITAHVNPDGDAIGACFGLALAIEKINKKPIVVLENYNNKFDVIEGGNFVYKGDINSLNPDLFISLDSSTKDRLGENVIFLDKVKETICIDHHIGNTMGAKYNFLNESASSTCELVFKVVSRLTELDKEIASALYAGIVFDTGGFRHKCTTSETLEIAAKLIATGIDFTKIQRELNMLHTLSEAKIFAKAISKVVIDEKVAISYITLAELEENNASKSDLDGIVGYLLDIRGVSVSVFIYQTEENVFKASFRAIDVNVREVAVSFGGGGHELAAGCSVSGSIDEVLEKIIPAIKKAIK